MKSLKVILILFVMLSTSCKENEINVSNDIQGEWRLQKVSFNGIDGKEINDWIHDMRKFYKDN